MLLAAATIGGAIATGGVAGAAPGGVPGPPANAGPPAFELQILHASDLEGGVAAIDRAPNFAAIVDKLEDRSGIDASITLSAGDNFIPGPFFSAAGDQLAFRNSGLFNSVYNDLFGTTAYSSLREGGGRVDISIMNIVGFDASAVGNHEFDLGSDIFETIVEEDFQGPGVANDRWVGAQFPYLSANLDFSGDPELVDLYTPQILPNTAFVTGPAESLANNSAVPKFAPATIIPAGGQQIGVVGATTPLLQTISSPTGTTVTPNSNDMPALAAVLQPTVDALKAAGINKIVLVSHLQQITLEQQLIALLDGVDVVIAGGSDTLLANADDPLRAGDTADAQYPLITKDAAGAPAVIVSTDGEYSYVGQLTVRFNPAGRLLGGPGGKPLMSLSQLDLAENGPVKTEDDDVAALWGSDDAFASGTKGELVQRLVDAAQGVVIAKDGNFLGETSVFLEGRRDFVRTEETNLGNLTADANLWLARQSDATTVISIKNGGGIRAEIGEIDNSGGTTQFLPPQDNPLVPGDDTGKVSQLDIENALRFNNGLSLVTLTATQLEAVLEHAVAASGPGLTPGQFAQVAGIEFTYDLSQPAGSRIVSATVAGGDTLVAGGVLQGDPSRTFRVVTLTFLVTGGDAYPFGGATGRVDLLAPTAFTGAATFAPDGSEQDALAEFLHEFHGVGAGTPYDVSETPAAADVRIRRV
jgi:2',3'-cyclic-nucleotide 2'-phosphodiesterase (5'-nucleotidase family)